MKLTFKERSEIHSKKESHGATALAKEYNVSRQAIYDIWNGKVKLDTLQLDTSIKNKKNKKPKPTQPPGPKINLIKPPLTRQNYETYFDTNFQKSGRKRNSNSLKHGIIKIRNSDKKNIWLLIQDLKENFQL